MVDLSEFLGDGWYEHRLSPVALPDPSALVQIYPGVTVTIADASQIALDTQLCGSAFLVRAPAGSSASHVRLDPRMARFDPRRR